MLFLRVLDQILTHNQRFVKDKKYEPFQTEKFPKKKLVIVSCMDTRLLELLPKAMNIRNGDAKMIKTAGALIDHPFGGVMKSILVAVYELGAKEICVVGHHECGMASLESDEIIDKMKARGITERDFALLQNAGIDLKQFLRGFECVETSVEQSVKMIQNHPLVPNDVIVHGLVIDPRTGKLDVVVNGYNDST